jgi:hypothetical protein
MVISYQRNVIYLYAEFRKRLIKGRYPAISIGDAQQCKEARGMMLAKLVGNALLFG